MRGKALSPSTLLAFSILFAIFVGIGCLLFYVQMQLEYSASRYEAATPEDPGYPRHFYKSFSLGERGSLVAEYGGPTNNLFLRHTPPDGRTLISFCDVDVGFLPSNVEFRTDAPERVVLFRKEQDSDGNPKDVMRAQIPITLPLDAKNMMILRFSEQGILENK